MWEQLPERFAERQPERLSECFAGRLPERFSGRFSERLPERFEEPFPEPLSQPLNQPLREPLGEPSSQPLCRRFAFSVFRRECLPLGYSFRLSAVGVSCALSRLDIRPGRVWDQRTAVSGKRLAERGLTKSQNRSYNPNTTHIGFLA
jgi:hypothetical protein